MADTSSRQKHITWEYVRQVLSGEKLLLKFNRIESQFQLPRAKGFYVKNIHAGMTEDLDFMRYFPDFPQDAHIPRDYFLTVH